jgi:hypothetical protein
MTTALRWSLRAALLALVACDGLTLVEPPPDEPALSIHLDAVSDESSRYDLNALFRRGTDARGHPTELVDGALYVEGTAILPGAERTPGHWSYRWEEDRAATGDQRDSVRVVFPVIATSPHRHSMTIPIAARDGPANVGLTRGEDLVLRVSPPGGATPPPFGGVDFWTLEIRQSCSSNDSAAQFTISGRGPFPSELRVPWQWLETLPVGSMSACFRAFASYGVVGSPYLTGVSVTVRITWRIHVVEPGSSL